MLHHILDSSVMFEHQSCPQHPLKPICYTELDYYRVERVREFCSSWQFGRTRQVIGNDGYCMKLDFCGEPMQLNNFDGQQRGTVASPHYGITGTLKKWTQNFQRLLCDRMNLEITFYSHNIYVEDGFFDKYTRSHKWRSSGSQL